MFYSLIIYDLSIYLEIFKDVSVLHSKQWPISSSIHWGGFWNIDQFSKFLHFFNVNDATLIK